MTLIEAEKQALTRPVSYLIRGWEAPGSQGLLGSNPT